MVLRRANGLRKEIKDGKLTVNWEGPFHIVDNLKNGAYQLEIVEGRKHPRTWNATHLKKYYANID